MTHPKSKVLFKGTLLLVSLFLIMAVWNIVIQGSSPPQELLGVLRAEPKPLKSFELVDQNGRLINEQVFKDKWSLVFFGYTSCPDICPTTLNVLNVVMGILGKGDGALLSDTQVVFVSVDPERDTTARLADYMAFFNKDFIGLTGDKKNIDNITQQFSAGYMIEKETAPGQYMVGHTSAVFLVGPMVELVAAFSQPHNPETIVSQYQGVRAYISK
jgi:protein SCO1/2